MSHPFDHETGQPKALDEPTRIFAPSARRTGRDENNAHPNFECETRKLARQAVPKPVAILKKFWNEFSDIYLALDPQQLKRSVPPGAVETRDWSPDQSPILAVRCLIWGQGAVTRIHDHPGIDQYPTALAAMCVYGRLGDSRFETDEHQGARQIGAERVLHPGDEIRHFERSRYIHRMRNLADGISISIHAYASETDLEMMQHWPQ